MKGKKKKWRAQRDGNTIMFKTRFVLYINNSLACFFPLDYIHGGQGSRRKYTVRDDIFLLEIYLKVLYTLYLSSKISYKIWNTERNDCPDNKVFWIKCISIGLKLLNSGINNTV